jgi:predicted AAA+ superfamily ATPase
LCYEKICGTQGVSRQTPLVQRRRHHQGRDGIAPCREIHPAGVIQEPVVRIGYGCYTDQVYNFERPEDALGKSWSDLYFEIKSKLQSGKPNYVFLDEVQNIAEFEKLVDGLFVTPDVDVYITGSNANLLSGELATLLSGRYIEISILPFSFAEYLELRGIDTSNKYLNYEALFFDYVNETSMPKGIELRDKGFDAVYEYLEFLYATIIEKDITQRRKINDKRAFGNIVKFTASNIGNRLSPSSISAALKADGQSIHHGTVEKFLEYLVESFVFYKVNRFDIKGKKQLATQEKYYIVDPGFLNILLGRDRRADRGHILENVVYLELLRRGYKVWTGAMRGGEIDFTMKNKAGDMEYYQVAWELSTIDTEQREFGALEMIKDNYPKYLLSTDSFPQSRDGIIHKNVFAWLLEK